MILLHVGFLIVTLASLVAGEPSGERCNNAINDGGPGLCVAQERCQEDRITFNDTQKILQDSQCSDKSFLCCPIASINETMIEHESEEDFRNREAPDGPPLNFNNFDHPKADLLPIASCGQFSIVREPHEPHQFLFYDEKLPTIARLIYTTARGEERFLCGGTLITSRYVLTAAGCVSRLSRGLKLSGIILGDYNVTSDPDCKNGTEKCLHQFRRLGIEKIEVHPNYEPRDRKSDLAIIRLDKTVNFTEWDLIPMCLPLGEHQLNIVLKDLDGSRRLITMGWGADFSRGGPYKEELRTGSLKVEEGEFCKKQIRNITNLVCLSGNDQEENNIPDVGGPLTILDGNAPYRNRGDHARVVQLALLTAHSRPLIFTQLGPHIPWILDTIKA